MRIKYPGIEFKQYDDFVEPVMVSNFMTVDSPRKFWMFDDDIVLSTYGNNTYRLYLNNGKKNSCEITFMGDDRFMIRDIRNFKKERYDIHPIDTRG